MAADSKYVSFSKPLAAMTSQSRLIDPLALAGDLHLHDRVEEQEAAVVGRGRAEVVRRAGRVHLHGEQAGVGVGQHPAHVRERRDPAAVEDAVVGVCDGLVERVLGDADRGPAEVDLADVDGGQCGVPRRTAHVQQVGGDHRVVVQDELRDVHLPVDGVLDQLVGRVAGVGEEEHVLAGVLRVVVGELAEDAQARGLVAVADVVLAAVGDPARLRSGSGSCRWSRCRRRACARTARTRRCRPRRGAHPPACGRPRWR